MCDVIFVFTSPSPHRSLLACSGFKVRVRVNDVKIGFSIGLLFKDSYARGDDRIGLQAD